MKDKHHSSKDIDRGSHPHIQTHIHSIDDPEVVHHFDPHDTNILTGPLSDAQESIWFLEKMSPGTGIYNSPYAYHLSGALQLSALENSVNEIIKRHASLRTNFMIVHGEPVQVINPELIIQIPLIDLASFDQATQNQKLDVLFTEETKIPFALDKDPLLRIKILRLSKDRYIVFIVIHHIITDDWSMEIFEQELCTLYNAHVIGKQSELKSIETQYLDYAKTEYMEGARLENQVSYWREQLKDAQPLNLPTDHHRPPKQSFSGASQTFELSKELVDRLKQIGQGGNATLYMTMLAAFNVMLSRYSDQNDILIGTPVANRTRRELENIIGYLVNTVVIRTSLSGNPTFLELITRVRRVVLEALMHQDLSIERLTKEFEVERDLSRNALFQVLFVYHNAPFKPVELIGLKVSKMQIHSKSAKVDLSLILDEVPTGIKGHIVFNTDLFETATISRMVDHFKTLLEGIVEDPDRKISSLPMLAEWELRQILDEWNNTTVKYPTRQCLHELVQSHVKNSPNRIAIIDQDRQITYHELNRRANQLAGYLHRSGVSADTLVGLYLERSIDFVIASLAILKTGGVFVPIDPNQPVERAVFMIDDARPLAIVTLDKYLNRLLQFDIKLINLDNIQEEISTENDQDPPTQIKTRDLCYVIYTSGSGGRPKGVQIEHASIVNFVHWWQRAFNINQQDIIAATASPAFDASVWEVYGTLSAGATLDMIPDQVRVSTDLLWQWLADHKITGLWIITSLALLVLEGKIPSNLSLRFLAVGGEDLLNYPDVKLPFPIYNLYGPTEATIASTMSLVDPESNQHPLIGRPIDNYKVYILGAGLNPVPIGVPGEICIAGSGLARGYLNDPELTAGRFIVNPFGQDPEDRLYKTGDLGKYHPDGQIEFLGRMDQQIKIRGYRVELGEIETSLRSHPAIKDAIVLAAGDATSQTHLVSYLIQDGEVTIKEIQEYLKERLPDYMIPSKILFLETFPLTPSGKIDRAALSLFDEELGTLRKAYAAPATDLEKKLVSLWMEVLNLKRVGVHDDFFALGGHSLIALRLMNLIEEKLGNALPLEAIFQAPTVSQQARILQDQIDKANWSPLVSINPDGKKTPFFCVSPSIIDVVTYKSLAKYLDPEQPFYTLYVRKSSQDEGMDGKENDAITRFIQEVQKIRPHGPYLLGGYSAGGHLALEMARRLMDQGEGISRVILIDTFAPGYPKRLRYVTPQIFKILRVIRRIESYLWKFWVLDWRGKFDLVGSKQQPFQQRLGAWLRNRLREMEAQPSEDPYGKVTLSNGLHNKEQQYHDCDITLIKANRGPLGVHPEPSLGWDKWCRGKLQVIITPGDHEAILFGPRLPAVARILQTCLDHASAGN